MALEQKDLAEFTTRIVVAAIQSGLNNSDEITSCYEAVYRKIADCDKTISNARSFN